MGDSSNVQALSKISTEVDESQIKIKLSSQCIKAQAFLVDKLKKQSERQKEVCNYISNGNFKLETEITIAEQEINSLMIAHGTIKSANVELKKEWLLIKERKQEILERIANGEKKYEYLWLQCKSRYESLPFVQKLLQGTNKMETLKDKIKGLENEVQTLGQELRNKKYEIVNLDRSRIIEMAQFFVHEMPRNLEIVKDKTISINELTKEIEDIANRQKIPVSMCLAPTPNEQSQIVEENKDVPDIDDWAKLGSSLNRDTLMVPKLQLINTDLDVLSVKLEQIKKIDIFNSVPIKRTDSFTFRNDTKRPKTNDAEKGDYTSLYFNKFSSENEGTASQDTKANNFSKKKLINILEDIKIDKEAAYNIVSKINPNKLEDVDKISSEQVKNCQTSDTKQDKSKPMVSDEIEEVDLTNSNAENILVPPTQFLDLTQNTQSLLNSSQSVQLGKKKVSFDLQPMVQEENNDVDKTEDTAAPIEDVNDKKLDESLTSQLNTSLPDEENYLKIKDMLLKKHHLDLSPQFVYAKNTMLRLRNDDKIITSKFFQQGEVTEPSTENNNVAESSTEQLVDPGNDNNMEKLEKVTAEMEVDEINIPSLKEKAEERKMNKPVAGLLFSHGPQGIPDSLDVSISTTGYEEGDGDFPHCLDSSLLLSPKGDIPLPMGSDNHIEVLSQEVPNFLSGLRKTGLSFFAQGPSSEAKPDSSEQNSGNNFNFNFSNDDKKNRGGLFSMFR